MKDQPTPSELFLRGIKQLSRSFRKPQGKDAGESQIQAIEAIRQRQAEHEEQRRRIIDSIAAGARISRRRDL